MLIYYGTSHIAGPLLAVVGVDYDLGVLRQWVPDHLRTQRLRYRGVWVERDWGLCVRYVHDWVHPPLLDELGVCLAQTRLQETLLGSCQPAPSMWQAEVALRFVAWQLYRGYMTEWHRRYPVYGWADNLGNGTYAHYEALIRYGPVPEIHRWRALRLLPSWMYRHQHRVGLTLPAWWCRIYGGDADVLGYVRGSDRLQRQRVRCRSQQQRRRYRRG